MGRHVYALGGVEGARWKWPGQTCDREVPLTVWFDCVSVVLYHPFREKKNEVVVRVSWVKFLVHLLSAKAAVRRWAWILIWRQTDGE